MIPSINPTSNDLLLRLAATHPQGAIHYVVIAQNTDEVQNIQNAPAISMGPYLIAIDKTNLLTALSVYSQQGNSREQTRLLYMNATALRIWRAMGKQAHIVGSQHRPPHSALLNFGVPFRE